MWDKDDGLSHKHRKDIEDKRNKKDKRYEIRVMSFFIGEEVHKTKQSDQEDQNTSIAHGSNQIISQSKGEVMISRQFTAFKPVHLLGTGRELAVGEIKRVAQNQEIPHHP